MSDTTTQADSGQDPASSPADDPNQAYCSRLADEVFKKPSDPGQIGNRVFDSKEKCKDSLVAEAKLQRDAAIETGYVPSKWLLEQELRAKKQWDAGAKNYLNQACFKDGAAEHADAYEIAARQGLTGVCFSGGGIRSATFNLGVLQALAQLGLLPCIDYLSSVSGGGYIHQFFASWILRHREGRAGVEMALIPQAEPGCPPRAPEPIKWLQRYASYLTPRRGIFSADTWTMIAVWFRNTMLNQIPIVAFLMSAFFLLNLFVQRSVKERVDFYFLNRSGEWGALAVGLFIAAAAVWSAIALGMDLYRQRHLSFTAAGQSEEEIDRKRKKSHGKLLDNKRALLFIIGPWLAMAVWTTYWFKLKFQEEEWWKPWVPVFGCALVVTLALVTAFAGGALGAYDSANAKATNYGGRAATPCNGKRNARPVWWKRWWVAAGFALAAFASAVVACAFGFGFQAGSLWLAEWISRKVGNVAPLLGLVPIDPWRVQIVILPALLLSVPYIAIELTLGLLGRDYADSRREWLARLRAWSLLYGMLWIGLTSTALLGPYLVYYVLSKGLGVKLSAAATLVVSHLTTVLAGSSSKSDGKRTSKSFLGYKPMDLLALAAAPVAIFCFLIVLSFAASSLADFLVQLPCLGETSCLLAMHALLKWSLMVGINPPLFFAFFAWKPVLLACAVVFALVAALFGWRLDINEFSMQSFYRNRLSRCYLGATTPERSPNPFTGFDMRSSINVTNPRGRRCPPLVTDLLPDNFDRLGKPPGDYDGPFPIFCTTLNLTTGEDLATQQRKGASFAFTPLYSGYSVGWTDARENEKVSINGYVPTAEYAYSEGGIHLDTAVAISGAAVNPNQGYNSNPALAFLMTFFNVRLGWWISNPRKTDAWRAIENRPTPKFPLLYLLNELFGSANDRSSYVNLSDGGHFDNMGLYELVRRRCKYIVVCDAEQDTEMIFCGIGIAINRCRADFGAEIDLDLRPLQIQEDGFSKTHCVVGTIQYPPPTQQPPSDTASAAACSSLGDTDDDLYKGTILYIKSSLVGDEPADILAYKLQHDAFPHDSTANQWFTETQFEGYRRLGNHIAMTALRPALPPARNKVGDRNDIAGLFESLYSIWYPPTPEMEQSLTEHMQHYQGLLTELRVRPELVGLAEALHASGPSAGYLVPWDPPNPASAQYAWQFANTLLDFMHLVYTDLQLAFPDNRTSPHADWWLCTFRRWCRVSLVHDTWNKLKPTFSKEFRLFAERELKLP